jgi:hypothetical protein
MSPESNPSWTLQVSGGAVSFYAVQLTTAARSACIYAAPQYGGRASLLPGLQVPCSPRPSGAAIFCFDQSSKCNARQDVFLISAGYAHPMSLSKAQDYINEAKERLLPEYIFERLLGAVDELNRTVKQMSRDVRRVRREIKQIDR